MRSLLLPTVDRPFLTVATPAIVMPLRLLPPSLLADEVAGGGSGNRLIGRCHQVPSGVLVHDQCLHALPAVRLRPGDRQALPALAAVGRVEDALIVRGVEAPRLAPPRRQH